MKTFCPICEKVLTVDLFPEFLYCEECEVGVKRIECRKSPEQVQANFDSVWVNKHSSEMSARLEAHSLSKYIKKLSKVQSILDIGCGSGLLVDMLAGKGYDSTGLDFSAEAIDFARIHHRGRYLCTTVDKTKGKYDLITMSHILEHVPDPIEFLQQLAHLLHPRPYGLLLIEVPNLGSYNAKSTWRRESFITLFDHTHTLAFSRKGLTLLLEKAGYTVWETKTETPGVSLLNRLISGLFRKLRGNPTIYNKQEKPSKAKPDRIHRVYKTIAESKLSRCLCYTPNRVSEHKDKGLNLIVLAGLSRERNAD